MNAEPTPVDMQAATQAVLAGQSLTEHLGLPEEVNSVLYAAAVSHYEAGQYPQAISMLMKLTPLAPRMPDAWALLGNCMMKEGRFPEALEAWSLALHLKPSYAAAHQVARTALALKDKVTAAVGLMAMHKHGTTPEHQAAYLELGKAMLSLPA
jgi:tetratricopeptide (TPR) repeat protein